MVSDSQETPGLAAQQRAAITLYQESFETLTRVEIGRRLGVDRNTVGRWIRAWEDANRDIAGLKVNRAGRPKGKSVLLNESQEVGIFEAITNSSPTEMGLEGKLWSMDSIRNMTKEVFSVDVPPSTVVRLLDQWNIQFEHPPVRHRETITDANLADWLGEKYPLIVKRSQRDKALIYWLSVSNRKKTHQCKDIEKDTYMISATTNRGKTRFFLTQEKPDPAKLLEFFRGLIADTGKKVHLILDSSAVARKKELTNWCRENGHEIRLFKLPPKTKDASITQADQIMGLNI